MTEAAEGEPKTNLSFATKEAKDVSDEELADLQALADKQSEFFRDYVREYPEVVGKKDVRSNRLSHAVYEYQKAVQS